jgi:ABC-type sugar transport system substrate-binding protein
MKVTRRIALTLGAAALLATGCSGTGASGDSGITIGLAVSTLNNPFFVELQQGAQAMADQLGAKLTVVDAQNDATNQVNQVQTLVTQGVKAIILNPVDSKQSAPAAKAAELANIPLISVDRSVEGKVAAEVASNNVQGGSLAAIELGRATSGEVAHLKGISGASASRDRGQGFEQGLNSGNIKVVASAVADFDRAKALNETTNLLQGHPNIKGIFAENDEMALGAIKALGARAGKDVMVVGFDGTPDGLKAIRTARSAPPTRRRRRGSAPDRESGGEGKSGQTKGRHGGRADKREKKRNET